MKNLKELFDHEIKDLYSAEKQLVDALPKMVKAASSDKLKKAFSKHLEETKTQFSTLEDICKKMDIKPGKTKCEAMAGLIKEAEGMIKENGKNAVKDAGLIACAQRIEHYEISGYGTTVQYAKTLGYDDVAQELDAILDQESNCNEELNDLAVYEINEQAV
jgi:ferritin-like metal-binding protein YciE